jgi:hypothetical protein
MTEEVDLKFVAAKELDQLNASKWTIIEEHSASYKWLMASLLAVNSGGLFALSESLPVNDLTELIAGTAFLVGILSSLSIAWLGQIASRKMLAPIGELHSFWTLIAAGDEFNQQKHEQIAGKIEATQRKSKWARSAGWLAVLSFVIAVAAIGVSKTSIDGSNGSQLGEHADTVEMPAYEDLDSDEEFEEAVVEIVEIQTEEGLNADDGPEPKAHDLP